MKNYTYFVLFSIDADSFAIPYERVVEATKSVEITPLPYPTKRILGIIDFHGKIIPVVNLRKLMKRQEKALAVSDSFLVINTQGDSTVAVIADTVHELIKPDAKSVTDIGSILPDYDLYEGTIKLGDKLIPIVNTEKLLTKKEKEQFEEVVKS